MSDESDETRRVPPADDETRPVPAASDETIPGRRLDETLADDSSAASGWDSSDDWASRANPVWSGRAEVRPPRPGQASYDADWSDGSVPPPVPAPGQRDRWWLPIVVGIIVLILLGVLAWAIYLIVQNSGQQPATTPTTPTTTAATTNPPSTAPSTAPSTEPTTTIPTTTATTQEPTAAVTVPALRGLTLPEARAALNRTGLRYRVLYLNSTAAPGTVIDSDPAEGQEVPPDTRVTIVVAQQGPATTPTATATTAATGTATTGG